MFNVTTNEGDAHINRCGKIFKAHNATFWCSGEMASLVCCWRAGWIGKSTWGKKYLALSPKAEDAPTRLSGNSILEQDFPLTAQWALHGSLVCRDFDPGGLGTGGEGRADSDLKSCVGFFWTLTYFHKYAIYIFSFSMHKTCYTTLPRICAFTFTRRYAQEEQIRAYSIVCAVLDNLTTPLFMVTKTWKPLAVSFKPFQFRKAFLQEAF